MRSLLDPQIARFRDPGGEQMMARLACDFLPGAPDKGVFTIPFPATGARLRVIVSIDGDGWHHVSVSLPNRCPNWPEMSFVAKLFFGDRPAMQLHVPAAEHVSCHPYTLHWWAPADGREIPRPPVELVGGGRKVMP